MNLCTTPGCSRPSPDAFVCTGCADALRRDLGDMPALLADLEVTLTRQDVLRDASKPPAFHRGGADNSADGKPLPPHLRSRDAGYALPSTPWPYSQAAGVELDDAVNTLSTWVRHLHDARGLSLPAWTTARFARRLPRRVSLIKGLPGAVFTGADLWAAVTDTRAAEDTRCERATAYARWLHVNAEAVRQDELGGQLVDEVAYLARSMRWVVDARDLGTFVGRCDTEVRLTDHPDVISILLEPCGAELYAREDYPEVQCPDCGTRYSSDDKRKELLDAADELTGTATEIAAALSKYGEKIKPERIRLWAHRGHIMRQNAIGDGDATYLVSAVRDLRDRYDCHRSIDPCVEGLCDQRAALRA